MKLASYLADGVPSFGAVTGDGVVTMNRRLRQRYASLREALAGGALDEMRAVAKSAAPDHDFAGLEMLPVIPHPGKTLCVGINYASHAAEHGGALAKPNIFTKFDDVLIGHNGTVGPWMVTADEIPDPSKLTLMTRLNGVEVQRSGVDLLMYSVPMLIEYVSTFTPLAPGDIIFTGTPDGIGAKRTPPLWMKDGDVIEVEISSIGTLRARVADEQ